LVPGPGGKTEAPSTQPSSLGEGGGKSPAPSRRAGGGSRGRVADGQAVLSGMERPRRAQTAGRQGWRRALARRRCRRFAAARKHPPPNPPPSEREEGGSHPLPLAGGGSRGRAVGRRPSRPVPSGILGGCRRTCAAGCSLVLRKCRPKSAQRTLLPPRGRGIQGEGGSLLATQVPASGSLPSPARPTRNRNQRLRRLAGAGEALPEASAGQGRQTARQRSARLRGRTRLNTLLPRRGRREVPTPSRPAGGGSEGEGAAQHPRTFAGFRAAGRLSARKSVHPVRSRVQRPGF